PVYLRAYLSPALAVLHLPLRTFLALFHPPPTPFLRSLSLHDALPILAYARDFMIDKGFTYVIPPFMIHGAVVEGVMSFAEMDGRSEEHTSELQSRFDLVCRLLLEKKKACGRPVHYDAASSRCRPRAEL